MGGKCRATQQPQVVYLFQPCGKLSSSPVKTATTCTQCPMQTRTESTLSLDQGTVPKSLTRPIQTWERSSFTSTTVGTTNSGSTTGYSFETSNTLTRFWTFTGWTTKQRVGARSTCTTSMAGSTSSGPSTVWR